MNLWLYLHYPSLQLDSAFAGQNEQAIIIVHGKKNEVVQLNRAAATYGVKPGLGLGTAAALCSSLNVHVYKREVEVARLKEISHWLYVVTSDITLFEPDGILLRIGNMLSLYGGLNAYWHTLQQHIQPLQVSYQFASGCSPLAARLLARAGANQIYPSPEVSLSALKQHPIQASDLSHKTIEKLTRMGIKTLGDLLNIGMADLARRFDIELVNYVGRLIGQFKHPVNFYHPPENFERFLELLFDVDNLLWLQKPLEKLLKQLESYLKLRDKLAHELQLILHQREADMLSINVSSVAGEYQVNKWLPLLLLRLESVTLSAPIVAISLKTLRIAERIDIKADLFEGQRGHQSPQELVSCLQAKLGQQAVKGLSLSDDPRPHIASQYGEPLSTGQLPPLNPDLLRPTILLPLPKPLQLKVLLTHGPERILTGWWDNKPIHRDYFVARSQQGQCLWVFRNHKHQWFIHGYFS